MKAVVLLSAGLDSSINLFEAVKKYQVVLTLTFNYGQRAADKEIESASLLSQQLKIPHQVVNLSFFRDITKTSLVNRSATIPQGKEVEIDSLEVSNSTAERVWVPNRNGIFLNVAAAYAESLGASVVIPGFNAEEAVTFPDNTSEFMSALDQSFSFSTANKVHVVCFTDRMTKTEIVRRGFDLGVPFQNLWPCYQNEEVWCGECESCQRYRRALAAAGLSFEQMRNFQRNQIEFRSGHLEI